MATLTANISSSTLEFSVSGTVTLARTGQQYRIDNEVITLREFVRTKAVRRGPRNPNRWAVSRGQAGTTAASHTAGATIYAVEEAVAVSTTLAEPLPFAGAPGAANAAAFVEPTTATPEAIAQALIDAGLMDAS